MVSLDMYAVMSGPVSKTDCSGSKQDKGSLRVA